MSKSGKDKTIKHAVNSLFNQNSMLSCYVLVESKHPVNYTHQ